MPSTLEEALERIQILENDLRFMAMSNADRNAKLRNKLDHACTLAVDIVAACSIHAKTHDNKRKDVAVAAAQRRAQSIMGLNK